MPPKVLLSSLNKFRHYNPHNFQQRHFCTIYKYSNYLNHINYFRAYSNAKFHMIPARECM